MTRVSIIVLLVLFGTLISNDFVVGKKWWDLCSSDGAHIKVDKLTCDPDPPRIGKNVSVTLSATVDESVTQAKGLFQGEYNLAGHWIPLPAIPFDICEVWPCPIQQGPIDVSYAVPVPGYTPAGVYKGNITAADQNGQELFCVEFQIDLEP